MREAVAMKWVEALRSGKYKKTKNYLKMNNKFCCLGVLHDIMDVERHNDDDENCHPQNWDKLGIRSTEGTLKTNHFFDLGKLRNKVVLAGLNDTGYLDANLKVVRDPLTFDEIADVIQMTYKEL